MDIMSNSYLPGDQRLIEQIVRELKSQGIFDQFRKECISDVDTKPAYQNLRQRVEGSVAGFLTKQTWNPDMNKNQVREMLRKNIYESGFLETGVERIVDQVVNPKINSVFLPKVEDVVYKFLGIQKPVKLEKNLPTPIKVNTAQDLLPRDLEAISPEIPEEKELSGKDEIDDVKMKEDESPTFEILIEKNDKIVLEENSVDSQSSILSGLASHDSSQSQKHDSIMSLSGSESRISQIASENVPKIKAESIFPSDKHSDEIFKQDLQVNEKIHIEPENQDENKSAEERSFSDASKIGEDEVKFDNSTVEIMVKSKDSSDRKRDRYSSSDKSKSRSDKDKDKDRSRSDRHKREEIDIPKEQKPEKDKYKIPKLSDKKKTERDSKSKDKDDKNRDSKTERKSDRDKKPKHSSERERSRSDSKSKKDNKSDKDDKRDKTDSSKSDKSRSDRKSSSKKRDSSSFKDRHKEKDKETKIKNNDELPEKNKNGHGSSNSSKKESSKYKKDEDKSRSSHKKDDKNNREKDDKKKRRSTKDDHYSSKEKKNERRSSDRDSDGASNSKKSSSTSLKNSEKYISQKSNQDSSCSNVEGSTGESGNSDQVEDNTVDDINTVQVEMQKIKLPKFASNLEEAMKIMKIRKQIKKLENMNKLNTGNNEVKQLLKDIEEFSRDGKRDKKKQDTVKKNGEIKTEIQEKGENSKVLALDINDFISSSNISMAKWNALEAKFMEEMGKIDYNSYESPYIDDEESTSITITQNYQNSTSINTLMDVPEESGRKNQNSSEIEVPYVYDCEHSETHREEVCSLVFENSQVLGFNEEQCITEEVIEETVDDFQHMFQNMCQPHEQEQQVIGVKERNLSEHICESNIQAEDQELSNVNRMLKHCLSNSLNIDDRLDQYKIETLSLSNSVEEIEKSIITSPNHTDCKLLDSFKKKAIVLLQKHSLTEAMIKKNGEFLVEEKENKTVFLKEKSLKVSEVGKENIETNEIVVNDETVVKHRELKMESCFTYKSQEKNVAQHHIEAKKSEKEMGESVANSNNSVETEENIKQFVQKNFERPEILEPEYVERNSNVLLPHTHAHNLELENEHVCKGLGPSNNQKALLVLNNLVKNVEASITKSIENIKKQDLVPEIKKVLQSGTRKRRHQKCTNSNNNLEDSDSKKMKTKNRPTSTDLRKTIRTFEKKGIEESTDILLETKFSLPLSPADSEADKRADSKVSGTKSNDHTDQRVVGNASPIKKLKLSGQNFTDKKNGTKQRYSCEDLYKPRIFLRRSAKNSKNS